MPLITVLTWLLLLSPGAAAWSSTGSPSDRRGFLHSAQKAAAAVVGTASVAAAGRGGVLVQSAEASVPVFAPPPGSLAGQVHVVTGASSGLGLESVKRLAAAGATVVATTRTHAKGEAVKGEVLSYLRERSLANEDVHAVTLDMDDLAGVRSFPERYRKELGSKKIDVLMNNAGRLTKNRETTVDGFEKTFQSNHLGPFLLTTELFPLLNREGSRVINVASLAHNFAKVVKTGEQGLDMSNLNGDLSYSLDGWEAYGNTKLENILFTQELQRRADAIGLKWLTTVSLHPGVVGTEFWRNSAFAKSSGMSLQALKSGILYNNVWSNEEGANTQVMLASAAADEITKGEFYNEFGKVQKLAPFARDEVKARDLWKLCESLSNCKFDVV